MYHYVYRITNTILNKHYYGKRSSKIVPTKDIGIAYFSSSKDVAFRDDQKHNPQNYKYKVVKTFSSSAEAIKFEILLHVKFNVASNNKFYNKAKQTAVGFDTTGTKGRVFSEETRNKLSAMKKGKPVSQVTITASVKARVKYANIYTYATNKLIASNVCIAHWARLHNYNNANLSRTTKADFSQPSNSKNRHHDKGVYARYIT